jgi:cytoskeletal protein CcmA (bactofilin family)
MIELKSNERSFFSAGTKIDGDIEMEGEVKLEGQISGKIAGTGPVTVGEQANVRANVYAPVIVVEGIVRGELHARDRLELHRTARVHGMIKAPRIRIDEGAVFEGECHMAPAEAARAEPPKLDERRAAPTAVAVPVREPIAAALPLPNKNAAQR